MRYEITVKGTLHSAWSDWFDGMTVSIKSLDDGLSLTTLTGQVRDQAALRGVLNKLWDLNLTLVSVISGDIREETHDKQK